MCGGFLDRRWPLDEIRIGIKELDEGPGVPRPTKTRPERVPPFASTPIVLR
jgi:hypothetical protein